jgi:hypothetical protein
MLKWAKNTLKKLKMCEKDPKMSENGANCSRLAKKIAKNVL